MATAILNSKNFTSKYTIHGEIYEKPAIQSFEKNYLKNCVSVEKCGLFIMKKYPLIGASPDGLIDSDSIVEVKCPYTAKDSPPNELTVDCLFRNKKNQLCLKEDRPYYYQVQTQLMVTDRSCCYFVVYTFVDIAVVCVYKNIKFINIMLKKLQSFYEKFLKPAILNKFFYRDYDKIFCVPKKNNEVKEVKMTVECYHENICDDSENYSLNDCDNDDVGIF